MAFFTYEQKAIIYNKIELRRKTKYKTGLVKKIHRDKKGNIIL